MTLPQPPRSASRLDPSWSNTGSAAMPRRYADYLPTAGFTTPNVVSSIGAFMLGVSVLYLFFSYRFGIIAGVDDPWGHADFLERATSCPPPRHNSTELPRIRSERPAFDLHYPHAAQRRHTKAHANPRSGTRLAWD